MEKYLELAKKLKRLSEEGIGGEKYNAQVALERLMKLHNITPDQLENEKKDWRKFIVKKADQPLFYQTLVSITGRHIRHFARGKIIHVEMTTLQFIEVQSKFDFCNKLYKEDLKIFYRAFIHKHNLFSCDPPKENPDENKKEANQDELLRMVTMMGGMQNKKFTKQLHE